LKNKDKKTEFSQAILRNKTPLTVALVCTLTSIISFNLGVYVGKSPSQEVVFSGLPTMASINESANLSPGTSTAKRIYSKRHDKHAATSG